MNPEDEPRPPSDTLINGMRHPRSSYSPSTVLVCEAMAHLAVGQARHHRATTDLTISATTYDVAWHSRTPAM